MESKSRTSSYSHQTRKLRLFHPQRFIWRRWKLGGLARLLLKWFQSSRTGFCNSRRISPLLQRLWSLVRHYKLLVNKDRGTNHIKTKKILTCREETLKQATQRVKCLGSSWWKNIKKELLELAWAFIQETESVIKQVSSKFYFSDSISGNVYCDCLQLAFWDVAQSPQWRFPGEIYYTCATSNCGYFHYHCFINPAYLVNYYDLPVYSGHNFQRWK